MKTYEDLTKAERNKLQTYLLMRINESKVYITFILGAFIFYAIALPLLITSYWFVSLTMIFISLTFFAVLLSSIYQTNKYIYLIFNIENSFEDIFKIKKTDILNLKKKWKKIE